MEISQVQHVLASAHGAEVLESSQEAVTAVSAAVEQAGEGASLIATHRVNELMATGIEHWDEGQSSEAYRLLFEQPLNERAILPDGMDPNMLEAGLRAHKDNPGSFNTNFQIQLQEWRYRSDPAMTSERSAERVGELLGREPSSWSREERAELYVLLKAMPPGKRPDGIDRFGVPANIVANDLGEFLDHVRPETIRYSRAWQFAHDPAATKSVAQQHVDELFARDPEQWTEADRNDLLLYMFDVPRELRADGIRQYGQVDLHGALDQYEALPERCQAAISRHVAAHHLNND
jgi:hypothetical protein